MSDTEKTFFDDVLAILTLPEEGTRVLIEATSINKCKDFFKYLSHMFREDMTVAWNALERHYCVVEDCTHVQFVRVETFQEHKSKGKYIIKLDSRYPRILMMGENGLVVDSTYYDFERGTIKGNQHA